MTYVNQGTSLVKIGSQNSNLSVAVFSSTNGTSSENPPEFSLSFNDCDPDSVWYSLDGGTTNYTVKGSSGTIDTSAWENSQFGKTNITFWANFSFGKTESTTIIVTKAQPSISWENVILMGISVIFGIALISMNAPSQAVEYTTTLAKDAQLMNGSMEPISQKSVVFFAGQLGSSTSLVNCTLNCAVYSRDNGSTKYIFYLSVIIATSALENSPLSGTNLTFWSNGISSNVALTTVLVPKSQSVSNNGYVVSIWILVIWGVIGEIVVKKRSWYHRHSAADLDSEKVTELFETAKNLETAGKLDQAISTREHIAAIQPTWENSATLGDLLIAHGEWERALVAFSDAITRQPPIPPTLRELYAKAASTAAHLGRWVTCTKAIHEVIALGGKPEDIWCSVVTDLERVNDFVGACEVLNNAIKEFPGDVSLLMALAHVQHSMGNDFAASQTYSQVVALDPKESAPWLQAARFWEQTGDLSRAIDAYNHASELDLGDAISLTTVARLREQTQEWSLAVDAALQALTRNATNRGSWVVLAHAYQALSQWADAATAYKQALIYGEDIPKYWRDMGHALLRAGDARAAEEALAKACSLDPADGLAHFWHGKSLVKLEDWANAQEELHEAIARGHATANTWTYLGAALAFRGQLPDALAAFQKAIELNPRKVKAWKGKMHVLEWMGKADTNEHEEARRKSGK